MKKSKPPQTIRTDEARDRMRLAARARHDANTKKTYERVRGVMRLIQQEMAANQGIYPQNRGAVSLAEVARRAKMHPVTFHKPNYQELVTEVKTWLHELKSGAIVGTKRVHKELGTRLQEWKQLYNDLLESHQISETDLAHATMRLKELENENRELRQKLAEATSPKVVSMRPKSLKNIRTV